MQRQVKAARDEQRKEDQDQRRADKAQLLAHDGEDKVVVFLRQVEILLPPVSETEAAHSPAADGVERLDDLIACVRGIRKGVQPGADAVGGILQHIDGDDAAQPDRAAGQQEPEKPRSADEHHHNCDRDDDDGGRKVGLQNQQTDDDAGNGGKGQHAVAEGQHLFLLKAADELRFKQNDRDLGDLRGLEGDGADLEPAARAVGPDAAHQHQQQHDDGKQQQHAGKAAVKADRKARSHQHDGDARHGKEELAREIVSRRVIRHRAVVSSGEAGREHHDDADGEQQQHQQQKRHIHAAASYARVVAVVRKAIIGIFH